MKITVDSERPNMAQGKFAVVKIDGEVIPDCIEADDDAGYADELILEKNPNGPGSLVKGKRRRYGRVTINYQYGPPLGVVERLTANAAQRHAQRQLAAIQARQGVPGAVA